MPAVTRPAADNAPVDRLRRRRRARAPLLAAVLLIASTPALAAKVYRCGNVFQDLPCATAQPDDSKASDKGARRDPSKDTAACSTIARVAGRDGRDANCASDRGTRTTPPPFEVKR